MYENSQAAVFEEFETNPNTFSKPSSASFDLKSSITNASFSINPKKWRFSKPEEGTSAAEYMFELKKGDLYAMAITEQVQISIEELSNIAYDNARSAAPDARIVKREYRNVNGNKVIYMEMVGTIQSIKFKYLGYYTSNESGSTQFLAYTGANLVEKYQDDIQNMLNGLISAP